MRKTIMKTLSLNLISTAVLAAAALATAPAVAQVPNPENGVACRAGTTPEFSGDTLRCRTERRVELQSMCSILTVDPRDKVDVTLRSPDPRPASTAGVDQCLSARGDRTPSVMRPPVPGVDPAATPGTYQRVVNPTGPDVFVATQTVYEFPQGWPFIGNASRGVTCGNGFDAERVNSNGLRCVKQEVKLATCDGGFSIDRRNGRDVCFKTNLLGNRETGQYTIPADAGYMGFTGNPSSNGWRLDEDRSGNRDYWIKRDRQFAFARVS
jgi:hypothetical protein